MSGSRGPNDRAPDVDPETRFRRNVRDTLAVWVRRIDAPGGPHAIGSEAAALRAVAQSHGWGLLAAHLQGVERVASAFPNGLGPSIAEFDRFLRSAGASQPPAAAQRTVVIELPRVVELPPPSAASVPPPPMLDSLRSSDRGTPAQPLALHGDTLQSERASSTNPPPAPRPTGVRPVESGRLPDSIAAPAPQPKLLVRSVLGFRAFDKKPPRRSDPPSPQAPAQNSPLLGFERRSSKPPARLSLSEDVADFRAKRRSSIPGRPSSPSEPWDGARRPRASDPAFGRSPPHAPGHGIPRWVFLLVTAIAVLAISTVVVVLVSTRAPSATRPLPVSEGGVAAVTSAGESEPAPKASDPMIDAVHEQGQGQETAELRALIDQQSRMLANCRLDATQCDKWARDALLLTPVVAGTFLASADNGQPLPAWLQRLKIPREFPAKDDPALAAFYGYDAKHPTGRAAFQLKLFRCAKFEDIFDTTLVKYGAPPWLRSVVYQESGCDPVIASPAGARGLWQFMPESARAYGLLVDEKGDVDERLNPAKATDAAIHFLMDLHTKLGAWDLALAAYNMGPYSLALRIAQVGGRAGFWDLRRSDLLPAETADYVPAIEAFALVLENRRSLGFPVDVPLPESTSELNVKPGTRLSLIARVARTSTTRVKEYNLDFLGPLVPAGETTARVPISSDQVLQVQQALDSWPADDARDTCAPQDYVWGSGDFEMSPYAKKCRASGGP